MIENPTLPEGWTSEIYSTGRHTVIAAPFGRHGQRVYVTIDWNARRYRDGVSIAGPCSDRGRYSGRGWQQSLIANAVRRLEGVVNS